MARGRRSAPGGTGRVQMHAQPDGTVRRSQAVTTYGPGAMMDLVKQAVLVGGLDFWGWEKSAGRPVIVEPRLRDALAARFEAAGRSLSVEAAFCEPPGGDDRSPSRFVGIQVVEFPTWFVCQSPRCRALTRRDALELKSGRYFHQCDRTTSAECVPVRFLGACKRGHCEDWPWISFAHDETTRGKCAGAELSLWEGPSGDFSQVEVRCTSCGGKTPLSAAYARRFSCSGERPWLGSEAREGCEEDMRLLVRTASNSYFSQVVGALSVPDPAHELDEKVSAVWDVLQAATPATLAVLRGVPKVQTALAGFGDDDVLAAIARRKKGGSVAREPIRTAEYRQFLGSKKEVVGELPPEDATFWARRVVPEQGLPAGIGAVVVAHKLREVRAQIGFTRIEPVTPDLQGEFDLGVESAKLGLSTDWLPATEIRGEGVLIVLDEAAVSAWEERDAVRDRTLELMAGHDAWKQASGKKKDEGPPFPGPRFYLLHSLAHLLVSAISLECGYAASAIRERLYCSRSEDPLPMAGILLSTGTTGSEGTLGGLVEQGRELEAHLRRAFDLGVLCSNDPVCASHSPERDHAERWLEGAACHGCLFIAECSCERFNRYLDRALVVPTMSRPADLAFFGRRP